MVESKNSRFRVVGRQLTSKSSIPALSAMFRLPQHDVSPRLFFYGHDTSISDQPRATCDGILILQYIQTILPSRTHRSIEASSLVLFLITNLPHLTQAMPSSRQGILELQNLDLQNFISIISIQKQGMKLTCCSICLTLKSCPLSCE